MGGAGAAYLAMEAAKAPKKIIVGVDACQNEVVDMIKAGKLDATFKYPTPGAKAIEVVSNETEPTLAGPSGFSWRKCSRLELHIYNIRHVQHHTGQRSAYLRRVDPSIGQRRDVMKWIGWGWREVALT